MSNSMSNVKHCGFCTVISGFMRRAMCIGSRRGSSESYYRELGDQDTLKIDGSQASEESVEIHNAIPTSGSEHGSEACQVEEGPSGASRASCSQLRPQTPVEAARRPTPEEVPEVALVAHDSVDMTRCRPTGRFLSMHKRRRKRLLTRSLVVEEALLDDLLIGQVQCILDQCAMWRFNAFTLDNVAGGRGLPLLCVHLFQVYGLISHFRLDPAKIWKLFSLFEENYHSSNPYHNSIHAADVTQAMHCFLQQEQILQHMQPIEVMAGLLAAIAHDLDHPGVNQPFLVATCNHLVTLYQSKSVLENHHWRSAISCLIESQILDDMPQYQQLLEDKIRSLILATDITRQQDYLGQFKIYLDTNTLDLTSPDHRHLVLQMALKCADISNPCRPWEISQTWSLKVCEEFFRQGDIERRLNLPMTPLCDRNTTTVPKIQTGFFKYVVTPLITEWHRFLQSDLSEQMLKNLVTNHKKWDSFSKGETSDDDEGVAEAEEEEEEHLSNSSEPLLPPARRGSLVPPPVVRDELRRFSVPVNVFQEPRGRRRDQDASTPAGENEHPLERPLSAEKLVSDSSIASITTPLQAQRINHMFQCRLVRQPTFPPLEPVVRAQSLIPRACSHDAYLYTAKSDGGLRTEQRSDTSKAGAGSRLRENLTAWHLDFTRRRKSMPAETLTGGELRFRELREVLPQLIVRTLAPRDGRGRRGSAPAPGAGFGGGGGRNPRARTLAVPPPPRRGSLPVEAYKHVELKRSSE